MVRNIKIYGIVQGVGFRPFVARLASRFSLDGTVSNRGSYVEIIARGSSDSLERFVDALRAEAPPRSNIIRIDSSLIEGADLFFDGFSIVESTRERGTVLVSPDIAICRNCRAELFDPNDRRYLHPFINCTDCGPRLTILRRMPYDRERTSMSAFEMCSDCAREYFDPSSRRFDAQPVCCNECGPEVYVLDGEARGLEAISLARKVLAEGGIVAIKGIGGFHLACDATSFEAVERLRRKKFRPSKPFAVMMKNLEAVERECLIDQRARELLDGHEKPIVLLEKRIGHAPLKVRRPPLKGLGDQIERGDEKKFAAENIFCAEKNFFGGSIAANVAPFNKRLGVMLPYTPLHHLLFELPDGLSIPDALVMTSGNIGGAPIARDDADARQLFSIADLILTHNREILIRADDSVVDADGSIVRRSRGFAPLPIVVDHPFDGEILAIGGELKNTFCLARDNFFYLSPYVGDLSDPRAVETLRASIDRLSELLEIKPRAIACDLHPRYQSTALAEELSERWRVPLVKVQHHCAHILSCMAENNFFEPVIGVAFDGTGFGLDGSIWGGEILIASLERFERFASIDPFTQAGGDLSSVDAWRSAISMLASTFGLERAKKIARELELADDFMIDAQTFLIQNEINCIRSTSAGRLFDAASALLGLCSTSTFEGEAAMRLQFAAESDQSDPINRLARAFHFGLAEFVARKCARAREASSIETVALSGGVFQNRLFRALTVERLIEKNFRVLTHRSVPANDGGLALGQALFAINKGGSIG